MTMLRGLFTCFICLLLLGACAPALAEVSVRTERNGDYVATQIFYAGEDGELKKVWSPRGRGIRKVEVLNELGDSNGDLWPAICESPLEPHYPLVVWSRFNGIGFDLAWSVWTGQSWRQIDWVYGMADNGDDLDPGIVFDSGGRPYIVWWRDVAGQGRVYASTLLITRWSKPFLISDSLVDSRYPTIEVTEGDLLTVTYETQDETVVRGLSFEFPDTITDDINPQISVDVDVHIMTERNY